MRTDRLSTWTNSRPSVYITLGRVEELKDQRKQAEIIHRLHFDAVIGSRNPNRVSSTHNSRTRLGLPEKSAAGGRLTQR